MHGGGAVELNAQTWRARRDELAQRAAFWIRTGRANSWLLGQASLPHFEPLLLPLPSGEKLAPELVGFIDSSRHHHWCGRLKEIDARRKQWENAGRPDRLLLQPGECYGLDTWLRTRPAGVEPPVAETQTFIERSLTRIGELEAAARRDQGRHSIVGSRSEASRSVVAREGGTDGVQPSRADAQGGRPPLGRDAPGNTEPVAQPRPVEGMGALKSAEMDAARGQAGPVGSRTSVENADLVNVTVFAPPRAQPASSLMIQVMLHMTDTLDQATARAVLVNDSAVFRNSTTLEIAVPHGAKAMVMLAQPMLQIAQPVQSIVWRGRLGVANFIVKTPDGPVGDLFPAVRVSLDGALVGELHFKLTVDRAGAREQNVLQPASPRRYTRAFFSYSSDDRVKVLEVAQSYRVAGIEFFQDVLNLDPGARWDRDLHREIENCDLFLLFWSRAASKSEWVAREAKFALELRQSAPEQRPDLVPLILEGPPITAPPAFLAHLHFNDWLRFAIAAHIVPSTT